MSTVPFGLPASCKLATTAQTPLSSVTLALMIRVHGQALLQLASVWSLLSLRVTLEMAGGVMSMGSGVMMLTFGVGLGASMTVTVTLADCSPPGPLAVKV